MPTYRASYEREGYVSQRGRKITAIDDIAALVMAKTARPDWNVHTIVEVSEFDDGVLRVVYSESKMFVGPFDNSKFELHPQIIWDIKFLAYGITHTKDGTRMGRTIQAREQSEALLIFKHLYPKCELLECTRVAAPLIEADPKLDQTSGVLFIGGKK